ncbi:MAG: efflux RND transporter permease subunit, partial [Rikenellaceae bacterium]|nr:efflux RND transporter permease subunit [Rikenellaceae bacterium]
PILPANVEYEYGGTYESNGEVIPSIIQVIIAGVFLIFLFLLFNYNKIGVATAALISMLFCIPGMVLGLGLTDTAFSMTCVLGLICLMGIIIRNTIMIFDHAEELRLKQHFSARQAAYDAGKRRMVPIFLTSATTAIGIVPMILGRTMLWMPMGIVIFAGTVFSMILVVTVVPVMYWKIFEKTK